MDYSFSFKNAVGGRTISNAIDIGDFPPEVVMALGTMGEKTKLALEWQERLDFQVNDRQAREYLKQTGGWSEFELRGMVPSTVAAIILWLACGDFVEYVRDAKSERGARTFTLGV